MNKSSEIESGLCTARLLRDCLSADPSERRLAELAISVIEPILASGAGPIVWWHLSRLQIDTGVHPALGDLRASYLIARLKANQQRQSIARIFEQYRAEGIEPILIKGWSMARLYPEPGLRPSSDIDISVDPEVFARAMKVVVDGPVDLHRGYPELDDLDWSEIVGHSKLVELHGVPIRLLSDEHQLRLLTLHFAKHAGIRPLWLADIVFALRDPGIDWEVALRGSPHRTRWCLAVMQLASELLGAPIDGTPAGQQPAVPDWLRRGILQEWGAPSRWPHRHPLVSDSLRRNPFGLFAEAARRWPSPIDATFLYGGNPFSQLPRWPFQTRLFIARVPLAVRQVMRTRDTERDIEA